MSERAVAIVGCGLVGGSLGLALRRRRPSWTIHALDLPEQLPAVRAAGFADRVGSWAEAPEMIPACGIVVLATPVEVAMPQLADVAPHLAPGTIVTDVCGTKAAIAERAAAVLPDHTAFVGGHPLAGSERAGFAAAEPLLFKGRTYVLCPSADTPPPAMPALLDLVDALEAVPLSMDPVEHDRLLATVSHLPHLVALALADAARRLDARHGVLKSAVGPAFLDMTRVAASSFAQWRGVLLTNKRAVLSAMDELTETLVTIRRALETDDYRSLEDRFESGNAGRFAIAPRRGSSQRELRRGIDELDEKLLRALGERLRAAQDIGRIKAESQMPVLDRDREQQVLTSRRDWGRALSLPESLVESLFELIMRHSREAQGGADDASRARRDRDVRRRPAEEG